MEVDTESRIVIIKTKIKEIASVHQFIKYYFGFNDFLSVDRNDN